MKEISLTKDVTQVDDACELMRIWMADGNQLVIFDDTVWDDPAAWGILLVDIMRHLSNAYEHSGKQDYKSALERIKQGMDAELSTSK